MVPVLLSILLVVLMSGAVLWVVAGDQDKPRSEDPAPADPEPERYVPPEPPPLPPPPPPRRPATSRRRPPVVQVPAAVQAAPTRAVPMARSATTTVRMSSAPLPRHRMRSSVLLVLLIGVCGLLVAVVLGSLIAALAFVLRAAVTS